LIWYLPKDLSRVVDLSEKFWDSDVMPEKQRRKPLFYPVAFPSMSAGILQDRHESAY
jgi:hypothetical protein